MKWLRRPHRSAYIGSRFSEASSKWSVQLDQQRISPPSYATSCAGSIRSFPMQEFAVSILGLSDRSSKLRDESDRLSGISEGLLEDSRRLRHDATELKINMQNYLCQNLATNPF
jgi:hypothetical protein